MNVLIRCTRCGLDRVGEDTDLFCPNCDFHKNTSIDIIKILREWINNNAIFINSSNKKCVRLDGILDFISSLERGIKGDKKEEPFNDPS